MPDSFPDSWGVAGKGGKRAARRARLREGQSLNTSRLPRDGHVVGDCPSPVLSAAKQRERRILPPAASGGGEAGPCPVEVDAVQRPGKIPVSLVTGYLGSGKTTLISRLLARPELADTAVIVNELGEVGIDHHLLRRVDERTVLLNSGCVCCTLRGDLADELRDLLDRRQTGEIPPFRRVVVETTGLADPTPIVNTLLTEPMLKHQYQLDAVVATVDAMHGLRGPESVKQAAVADVLVVTKVDAAEPKGVERELRRLNPAADVVEASFGDVEPGRLFGKPRRDPRDLVVEEHDHAHDDVRPVCLFLDEELDWTAFGIWLTMLLQARGEDVLRVKGLLNVGGDGPLLVNCVQHVVHPPEHLDAWTDGDRRSRLVLIGRGLDAEELAASLRAFNAAARA